MKAPTADRHSFTISSSYEINLVMLKIRSSVSFVAKDDEIFRLYDEATMNTQFIIWQVIYDIILYYIKIHSEKEMLYQLQSKCDLAFVTLIFYLFGQWTIFKYHNYYVFFKL
jgi:hypothetical protein